jgi:excinuclease ABC subunit C
MKSQILTKLNLPAKSGVYKFVSKDGQILYIGKATNLKDRTKSYFTRDLINTRGPIIVKMVEDADTIEWQETDTVLEAIILEANLIKKIEPKYNTKEKDNKSYNYVCITDDEFPRVITVRGRILNQKTKTENLKKYRNIYGPYPSGEMLRSALKIIRKIFPFLDAKTLKKDRYEFYKQLHLAPDVGLDNARSRYLNNIKNIELFFNGEKNKILKSLEREMLQFAKRNEFERAGDAKKQIFALTHINEVSLLKSDLFSSPVKGEIPTGRGGVFRIEAYDIAHLSGSDMVGAFSVIQNGEKEKDEYRVFNIRGFTSSNDAGALREIVKRRFAHTEWKMPDLIVADGNDIQKSVIDKELKILNLNIPVVAVVKDKRHIAKAMIGEPVLINKYKKQILLANTEAHRFVLSKHKKKRTKNFLPQN